MRRVAGLPAFLLVVDLAVLAAIPGILATIHFGVPAATELLAFDHGRVRGYTLLTTAYVHGSDAHLYDNLVAYALIVWFPYLLSVSTDDRRWFYRVTTALLLVVPVLTSLTNYLVLGVLYPGVVPVSLGFSSVIAGFIGLYLVSIMRVVAEHYSLDLAGLTGVALGIEVIQIAAVRYDPRLTVLSVAVLITAGLVITRRDGWRERIPTAWAAVQPRTVVVQVLFVVLLAVNAGVYIRWLFPRPQQVVRPRQHHQPRRPHHRACVRDRDCTRRAAFRRRVHRPGVSPVSKQ
jgi:hypothetical protein